MFSFFRFSHLITVLRTAISKGSVEAIEAAAVELADFVGLAKETKSLVAVIEAARSGSVSGAIRATGVFLIDVADAISGPAVMRGGEQVAPELNVDQTNAVRLCKQLSDEVAAKAA
jgi:hypothetical protein